MAIGNNAGSQQRRSPAAAGGRPLLATYVAIEAPPRRSPASAMASEVPHALSGVSSTGASRIRCETPSTEVSVRSSRSVEPKACDSPTAVSGGRAGPVDGRLGGQGGLGRGRRCGRCRHRVRSGRRAAVGRVDPAVGPSVDQRGTSVLVSRETRSRPARGALRPTTSAPSRAPPPSFVHVKRAGRSCRPLRST